MLANSDPPLVYVSMMLRTPPRITSPDNIVLLVPSEKVDRKTGWQFICLEEEWARGYLQEIQDFMECVTTGRQPLADLGLAYETIKVSYAGYWSAEEGRRIAL